MTSAADACTRLGALLTVIASGRDDDLGEALVSTALIARLIASSLDEENVLP